MKRQKHTNVTYNGLRCSPGKGFGYGVLIFRHATSQNTCTCGLWAWTKPQYLRQDYKKSAKMNGYLYQFENIGKIVEGVKGRRHSFATFLSISS